MQAFEEGRHGARVEAGFLQGRKSNAVCFLFMRAGEFKLPLDGTRLHPDDGGLRRFRVAARSQDGHRDGGHGGYRVELLPSHHARQVMLRDVGDFMCQHRGQFRFALRGKDKPAVHPNKAAGQCEGVDAVVVEDKKFKRLPRLVAVGDQLIAELIEVVADLGIVQIALVGANFEHALLAYLSFLLRRQ